MSSGLSNRCTGSPDSAQNAVMSAISLPPTNPFEECAAGSVAMRSTTQSLPRGAHAPAGIVTVTNPSADVSVVALVGDVLRATGGGVAPHGATVEVIRDEPDLPAAPGSVPVRT